MGVADTVLARHCNLMEGLLAGKKRNALVSFFEVQDADNKALAKPVDWPAVLGVIAGESMNDRRHMINGVYHWGQIYTYKSTYHLILARRRDEVSSLDTSTGEIIDSESDASKPWVEVSVVHFLPDSNRFGFVLGSNAAPRASSMAHWINTHNILDQPITVAPVLDKNVIKKIQNAESASLVKVTFETTQVTKSIGGGGLFEVAQGLKNQVTGQVPFVG
jgi:hypothetical protein